MKARTAAAAALGAALLAGAAPPAPPPPPSSAPGSQAPSQVGPEQLKQVDATLRQAEDIVLDVESMARGGSDGSGCPASFTVRAYMEDIRAKRLSKEAGDDLIDSADGAKEDSGPKLAWQFYYVCEALAAKNPAACAEADSVKPKTLNRSVNYKQGLQNPDAMSEEQALQMQQSQSYQGKCVNAYHLQSARAAYVARSPQFMDVCKQAVPHFAEVKDPASGEAMCRAWRDYNGDAGPFIAAIQAGVAHPLKREYALGVVREMTVAEGVCSTLDREYFRRACKEMEDYRAAFQAKDAGRCRTGVCRVLMGQGAAACESYGKQFRASACTQRYAADFVAGREKSFKAYADQVESALGEGAGLGAAKQLKEINARLDKLYDLRARFDRAADSVVPKTAPRKGEAKGAKKDG